MRTQSMRFPVPSAVTGPSMICGGQGSSVIRLKAHLYAMLLLPPRCTYDVATDHCALLSLVSLIEGLYVWAAADARHQRSAAAM